VKKYESNVIGIKEWKLDTIKCNGFGGVSIKKNTSEI